MRMTRPRSLSDRVAVAGLLGSAFFLRLPVMWQALDRDLATYATIGAWMWRGALPYRDLFDHKQPLAYSVYWLISAVAPTSTSAIRLAAALVAGLTAVIVFLCCRSLIGRPRALLAGALTVVIGASRQVQGMDLNTEHLLAPIASACVLLPLVQRRNARWWVPLIVGVLGGLAVLAKAIGALTAVCALIPLLATRRVRRESVLRTLGMFGLGVVMLPGLVVVAYWIASALPELYYWNITFNRLYMAHPPLPVQPRHLVEYPGLQLLVPASALVGLWSTVSRRDGRLLPITALAWLASALIGAKMGSRDYPHYFAPVVPVAAVLMSLPVSPTRGTRPGLVATVLAFTGMAMVVLPYFVGDLAGFRHVSRRRDHLGLSYASLVSAATVYGPQAVVWTRQEEVGVWLRAHSEPGDTLFVAHAEPGFYWASGLRPLTPYLYDSPRRYDPSVGPLLGAALAAAPPRFVVLPYGKWPEYVTAEVSSQYSLVQSYGDVLVFGLNESEARP